MITAMLPTDMEIYDKFMGEMKKVYGTPTTVNDNSGLLFTVDMGTVWKNEQGKVITSYAFSKEDDKGLLIVSAKPE